MENADVAEASPDEDLSVRSGARAAALFSRVTLLLAAVMLTLFVAGPVWSTARLADPIIEQLETENGGPLSAYEWYEHDEARTVFCEHPDDTEPVNRFGQYIDGGELYQPYLILKTLAALAAQLLVFGLAEVTPRRWRRALRLAAAVSVVALVTPLILYADTISAVSNIVE